MNCHWVWYAIAVAIMLSSGGQVCIVWATDGQCFKQLLNDFKLCKNSGPNTRSLHNLTNDGLDLPSLFNNQHLPSLGLIQSERSFKPMLATDCCFKIEIQCGLLRGGRTCQVDEHKMITTKNNIIHLYTNCTQNGVAVTEDYCGKQNLTSILHPNCHPFLVYCNRTRSLHPMSFIAAMVWSVVVVLTN